MTENKFSVKIGTSTHQPVYAVVEVKSKIDSRHTDNEKLKAFLTSIIGNESLSCISSTTIDYDELDAKLDEHTIRFTSFDQFKQFMDMIVDHDVSPITAYKDITSNDFELHLKSSFNSDFVTYFCNKKMEMVANRIDLTNYTIDCLAKDIQQIDEKLSSIVEFVNSNGLSKYKSTIKAIITALDKHEIVDKDFMFRQIFPDVH